MSNQEWRRLWEVIWKGALFLGIMTIIVNITPKAAC